MRFIIGLLHPVKRLGFGISDASGENAAAWNAADRPTSDLVWFGSSGLSSKRSPPSEAFDDAARAMEPARNVRRVIHSEPNVGPSL